MTVRELTRISCSLRDVTAMMPDVLRFVRQYGFTKDLVSVFDDLALLTTPRLQYN
jgi:hypothetical protein